MCIYRGFKRLDKKLSATLQDERRLKLVTKTVIYL